MPDHILQIRDAPLPTPNPWAADPEDRWRCPACGLADPGAPRCRRCRTRLVRYVRRVRPMTTNLLNLCIILLGQGPLLIAVGVLYREPGGPFITPWTIWLALQIPFLMLAAVLLSLRLRAGWFLAACLALSQLILAVLLQLLFSGHAATPIAAILGGLMLLGLLLNVYDEVRLEELRIDLPPEHAWPGLPADLYNLGANYSNDGFWYMAARLWQRAVALEPSEGRYRRALALAYARLHLIEPARAELAAAQILLPDDPQVLGLARALDQVSAKVPSR